MTNFKRYLTLFLVVFLAVNVWGDTETYTFNSLSWGAKNSANEDANWTSGAAGNSYSSGVQVTAAKTGANATSPISFSNVSKVTVYYHQNNKDGVGSIKIQVGSGTEQSFSVTKPSSGGGSTKNHEYSFSPAETGKVKITVTCTSNSIYIESIKIDYTSGGPSLSSIAVETAPTKITYSEGQMFNPAGLVITRYYDNSTSDTYAYDGHESDFTFSPSTSTALTTSDASVTITYGGKSTTQAITVSAATADTYDLVTDADDLSAGDEIIILDEDGNAALSNTQNTNNRGATDQFTLDGTTVTVSSTSDVQVLTLGASSTNWTLSATSPNAGATGYLYAASSSGNYLKTRAANSDDNSVWDITISSGIASIVAQGSYSRNVMQYNSGSSLFACYSSDSQTDVKIYRKSTNNPAILAPASITGFAYELGEGPDVKSIGVSGKNLTGNLTVTVATGDDKYQISRDNSTWSSSLTLTESAGTVALTTIYIRLKSGLALGSHYGSITISGGGATTKTVLVSGAVTLTCSTPTLTFGGTTSLEKVLGSGKFTVVATSPNNTLEAAITYSSSNTSKAEVNATTGEVTLKEATGSGSPVTITATLAAKNTGVACQDEVTASYTLTIYNKVTWYVNEDEYTGGSPTTQVLQGGSISTFPSDPNGAVVCGGKTFMGWTTEAYKDWDDATLPPVLYATLGEMGGINITTNTNYYAVFATKTGTINQYKKVTNPASELTDGQTVVIVNTANSVAFKTSSSFKSGLGVSISSNKFSTTSTNIQWIVKPNGSGGYAFKYGDNYLTLLTANPWINLVSTPDYFTLSGSGPYVITSGTNTAKSLEYYNSNFTGYNTGTGDNFNMDFYIPNWSLTDVSTSCGTCLYAPTSPTVVVKSDRVTISWDAVPDATGYTVTCTGGLVSVVGTTATITGLASNTTYTYSIRSQGGDPYTCFPAYNSSFTTSNCDDVPVLGIVSVTTTTATVSWTCEAATATIRVYADAACTSQVGSDYTSCTSPYTITPLTSNTTYYYKIFAGGTCSSSVGTFTTEEIKLDIAEWQTDAVVVSFNGDASLTLTTLTEETHGDPHANVADDIFFSKYFEAAANVKLLAVFNGTMESVDLSNYQLGQAQSGGDDVDFNFTKFSDFVKNGGGGLTADELLLESNEELIIISYDGTDNDNVIINCAKADEENSHFSSYIRLTTPFLRFNGDDAVALLNPAGTMIDLIGAGTKAGGSDHSGASLVTTSKLDGSVNGFMDKPGGWYTTHGYQVVGAKDEAPNYALSTNRCLLIRRNHVKSGHDAVTRNATDFVTLGDYTYLGDDYEGEWKGVQIPGSTKEGSDLAGLSNSCNQFNVVGSYNYNEYYVDFEVSGIPTTFDDLKSNPFDGTYVIPVTDLDDKACTMVRIELKDGSDNLVIRKDVKVPIMIESDQATTDDVFHSHYKDAVICRACDVVILGNGTLTKVADGTTGDINEVRDLKIYPGGKLVVPTSTNYTVNSLAFRRQEDEVSTADIQGGLTVNETDAVYLDVRIDPTNWHYFTLPYDCNVSDITFSSGDPATLGTDYLLKWYNGERRAATQAGGCWEMVGASSVLKKGIGYIVALPGDDIIKKELRFPMANTVITDELTDKTIAGVYAYGGDKTMTEVRANHRGWNLIGNPYFLPYTSDIGSPVMTGYIVEDHSTDPWDGHFKFADDARSDLRYIVEPVDNGWSEYRQVALADYSMTPFTCYFVQIGGTNPSAAQGIVLDQDQVTGRSSIVRRKRAEYEEVEDTHPVWCAVDLINSKDEKDETTLLISNDFTDEYDMMNDLVKMRGDYYQYAQVTTKPVLASRNNEGEMAFNALPDASAEAGVPLNFFSAYSGSYTIAYNDKFDRDSEVKEVKLFDKTTNKWYDLMNEPYEFSTDRTNNTDRFILSVRVERKKTPQIATDIDNIGSSDGPRKLLIDGHVYIQRGNRIYDVTGKQAVLQ